METEPTSHQARRSTVKRQAMFLAVLVALIAAGIVRSSITTSLDSFTFDEAYHIGAGASYIQTGDFRLNPEQPPLTKLWVGAYVTMRGYELSEYRAFADKGDERDFVEQGAYFKNDPFVLQARARTAMFALNGLLILIFSIAAWRAFGPIVSIAATAFLAIDPTVAAHMPVVMTDLPVAYQYFSDEGTDLGLRVAEIAAYYEQNLKPSGEIPYLIYFSSQRDRKRRGLDWVGNDLQRDASRIATGTYDGTIIIGAEDLAPKLWWDMGKPLREAEPVARMGNVFVFKGTFERPKATVARALWFRAMYTKLYVPEPDVAGGIAMLGQSAELDPAAFCVSLELGNQYLKLGKRDEALRAYRIAYEHAPRTDGIFELLGEQVRRIESGEPMENISTLRNPAVE